MKGGFMKGELRSERKQMFRRQLCLVVFLWLSLLASAFMVIYSSYDARLKFDELEVLRKQQDRLYIEWSQYLLEESTWASFGRIEKMAAKELSMQIPTRDQIIMVDSSEK